MALLHKSAAGRGFPFAGADSSHGFSEGYGKCGEAVQDGDPDLKLGNLSVEVPGIQTLAQQLHTMRLRFDAAPAVVAAPSSSDGSPEAM